MKSVVSEKGQVTIPKALRDALAIGPGTELDFTEEDGKLVARRVFKSDAIRALLGFLPRGEATDAYVDDLRGPRWTPELDGKDPVAHRDR
jgi:AbrB family looped-hinge helix DNA binding protein